MYVPRSRYDNYRDPPLNYTLKGNVMVGLVVGVFSDVNTTASDKALWSGWHNRGAEKMFWRPNVGGRSGVGPSQVCHHQLYHNS